jgi:hypothetical protein
MKVYYRLVYDAMLSLKVHRDSLEEYSVSISRKEAWTVVTLPKYMCMLYTYVVIFTRTSEKLDWLSSKVF